MRKIILITIVCFLAIGFGVTNTFAKLSQEEIARLGTDLTPLGADPEDEYVALVAPLALYETKPAAYGSFNAGTNTWTVT